MPRSRIASSCLCKYADDADQGLLLSGPVSTIRSNEQQLLQLHGQDGSDRQDDQMLLLDLVSFDHCQEVCHSNSVPGPRVLSAVPT